MYELVYVSFIKAALILMPDIEQYFCQVRMQKYTGTIK